jgi:hypothetical protein
MNNNPNELPPLLPPTSHNNSTSEVDIGFESTFDLQFPIFTQDNYTLDIERGLKITQRVRQLSVVDTPRYEDRKLFEDILSRKPRDLIERGLAVIPEMQQPEIETFTTAQDVIDSGTILAGEPRKATSEPIGVDITDIPEAAISEEPLLDVPQPSTSSAMEVDLPPLDISDRTLTNKDIQEGIFDQERQLFPRNQITRQTADITSHIHPTPPPTHQLVSPVPNPTSVLTEIQEIKHQLTTTLNLIKAQSGLFTLMKELHTDFMAVSLQSQTAEEVTNAFVRNIIRTNL